MIHYLERFGGYVQFKELGLIHYALAHIADALVHSGLNGAIDYLALLMVGVDQANLDGNRWELAYRMMLLQEPPSRLWGYRNQSFDPRSKSFSSLAPQQWTYSKEMDYIQTKSQEVTHPKASNQVQPTWTPGPKKKGRFPVPKGKSYSTEFGKCHILAPALRGDSNASLSTPCFSLAGLFYVRTVFRFTRSG